MEITAKLSSKVKPDLSVFKYTRVLARQRIVQACEVLDGTHASACLKVITDTVADRDFERGWNPEDTGRCLIITIAFVDLVKAQTNL